ncbi:unnamed protein product [Closterium sp. NIES-64]|nr:unnamed protein product [Closterium sp. NIES-64]
MEAVSSARSRPTALSVSVSSAPTEAPGVAHTRRPSASGNVPSGSPVSTPPTRSRSRSLAALAAVMGGGKAVGANFCGGARWHAMWSAALVLLTIVGIMTWESFHANHRTKGWRRNQLVILENASISSSSYSHSSSAYNHGNSLRSQQGGSNSEAGVEQSARSPLRADSVLVLASGLREGLASPPGEKIGGSEAGDFSGGDNNGSDASGGDGGTGDTEASDSLESGVDKGGEEMSGGGKGGGNEMKEVGRWVRARQRALYSGKKCKWISLNWACARSNRPREMRQYERLRWQPRGCNAKRFSADGFFRRGGMGQEYKGGMGQEYKGGMGQEYRGGMAQEYKGGMGQEY